MKFTMNSGVLADHIAAAISSLPSRPTAAVMGGVLVEAQLGAVTLSSFNWDRSTARVAAADVAEPDTAVVAGRLLAVVGGHLPKNLDADVTATDGSMLITAGRTEFRLPLLHTDDYPTLPAMGEPDRIGSVEYTPFAEAVATIGGLAGKEAALPKFAALNVQCLPGELLLSATDRYVIGRRRLDWSGSAEAVINVPAADLLATIKAVGGAHADNVELLWNGALLGLRSPHTTVTTRVLDEEFPRKDVERVLSASTFHSSVTVPLADLLSMLRRAASVADDEHAQVRISADGDALVVTTTQSAVGNVVDSIGAVHYGPDRSVGLSARRMQTALSTVADEQVTLAFQESGHLVTIFPGVFDEPVGGVLRPPDTDTVAVLMGIRSNT